MLLSVFNLWAKQMRRWTGDDIEFLKDNYPTYGLKWCMEKLNRSRGGIRQAASDLGLRVDPDSAHFKEWQSRAASSKVGKKRPDQALVMLKNHADGKMIKTEEQCAAISIRVKKWMTENPHPRGALGMRHTEDTKNKISAASRQRHMNMTEESLHRKSVRMVTTKFVLDRYATERKNVSWKGGIRQIGGYEKYYRSTWEANFARYLQIQKNEGLIRDWGHETKLFIFPEIRRGNISYLPDFEIETLEGQEAFYEIKGWFDAGGIKKLELMVKHFSNIPLTVIDTQKYREIEALFSMEIPDWEFDKASPKRLRRPDSPVGVSITITEL